MFGTVTVVNRGQKGHGAPDGGQSTVPCGGVCSDGCGGTGHGRGFFFMPGTLLIITKFAATYAVYLV